MGNIRSLRKNSKLSINLWCELETSEMAKRMHCSRAIVFRRKSQTYSQLEQYQRGVSNQSDKLPLKRHALRRQPSVSSRVT